jgi:hypothetical protein
MIFSSASLLTWLGFEQDADIYLEVIIRSRCKQIVNNSCTVNIAMHMQRTNIMELELRFTESNRDAKTLFDTK